ncbi:hypothetical protein MUK42_19521 [Musa troglodytarum]|uniref:cysteine dioxygenase n=1 Tax=Musa troglodytarum TaxID=320322 RepID=A0A9E7K3N1_9LILI|nr:hypothetical protein MUK42_19521 [Musa troglodytarum]
MARSKVQTLYDTCEAVFCSGHERLPTLSHIRWQQDLLDSMETTDLGIDGSRDESWQAEETSARSRDELVLGHAPKKITYIHIHECQDFSDGVFCFPASAAIPLHDHPRMVVLTKALYGSTSWNAYDWVITPNSIPPMSEHLLCSNPRFLLFLKFLNKIY